MPITGPIYQPLEDPNEPSYTLGHAPASLQHDEDLEGHISAPEQAALVNRLELARGAGHRYLTLHWGDGTVCDKTGRKRETEIQVGDGVPPLRMNCINIATRHAFSSTAP